MIENTYTVSGMACASARASSPSPTRVSWPGDQTQAVRLQVHPSKITSTSNYRQPVTGWR